MADSQINKSEKVCSHGLHACSAEVYIDSTNHVKVAYHGSMTRDIFMQTIAHLLEHGLEGMQ